jgi:PKD domain
MAVRGKTMHASIRRALKLFLVPAIGLALVAAPAFAQTPGALNLQLTPSPSSAAVGQPITFTYRASPPAVAPPFPVITSFTIDFGDGHNEPLDTTGAPGAVEGTITYSYTSAGAYTPRVSAESSNGESNSLTTSVTITGGSSGGGGPTVTYGGGWNLIGVPDGTVLPPTDGLYTYRNGSYQTASSTSAGTGYWASFPNPTNSISLPDFVGNSKQMPLPAGQWTQIGNPYSVPANVSGADIFYGYDSENGYRAVTQLSPGLGAWAYSASGGTATISPALLR